jgi:hypothetical protein
MSGPLLVLNVEGLVYVLIGWGAGLVLIARGLQIMRRHDFRHYGRAIAWIVLGVLAIGMALAIIYLVGFGFGYRLLR